MSDVRIRKIKISELESVLRGKGKIFARTYEESLKVPKSRLGKEDKCVKRLVLEIKKFLKWQKELYLVSPLRLLKGEENCWVWGQGFAHNSVLVQGHLIGDWPLVEVLSPGGGFTIFNDREPIDTVMRANSDVIESINSHFKEDDKAEPQFTLSGGVRVIEKEQSGIYDSVGNIVRDKGEWKGDEHVGKLVKITGGAGAGQTYVVARNSEIRLYVTKRSEIREGAFTFEIVEPESGRISDIRYSKDIGCIEMEEKPETFQEFQDLLNKLALETYALPSKFFGRDRSDGPALQNFPQPGVEVKFNPDDMKKFNSM